MDVGNAYLQDLGHLCTPPSWAAFALEPEASGVEGLDKNGLVSPGDGAVSGKESGIGNIDGKLAQRRDNGGFRGGRAPAGASAATIAVTGTVAGATAPASRVTAGKHDGIPPLLVCGLGHIPSYDKVGDRVP